MLFSEFKGHFPYKEYTNAFAIFSSAKTSFTHVE